MSVELHARRKGTGEPLLLLHGFPCTSEIWSRLIPLASGSGFDVAAPDLRGFGASPFPDDGRYDLAAHCADLTALCAELGWSGVTVAAHDLGASVALELARRRPDLVVRLVLMNHAIEDSPTADDLDSWSEQEAARIFDYAIRQGHDADGLMAELSTPSDRVAYVVSFYRDRGWCPPDAFSAEEAARLAEPFGSADRLRAAFRDYEIAAGRYPSPQPDLTEPPIAQPVHVVLGTHDATLVPHAEERCRAAYPWLDGLDLVPDAGHFLPWERPDAVMAALTGREQ